MEPTQFLKDRVIVPSKETQKPNDMWQKRKQNAAILANHYTMGKRVGEYISVTAYFIFLAFTIYRLTEHISKVEHFWPVVFTACILSMLLADLLSGFVHWGADTWGNFDTPFVGKTFIRSFREHHVDPTRMCQHDFVETNGDNCMVAAVPLLYLCVCSIQSTHLDIFNVSFLALLCIWVSFTNQIHKWSHMNKPPVLIAFLQDYRIILSRKSHAVHHHNPFDQYYCITTGWLNPILGYFNFWKTMEGLITKYTGAIPREDDAFWTVQNNDEKKTF